MFLRSIDLRFRIGMSQFWRVLPLSVGTHISTPSYKLKAPECVSQERASREEERKDPSGVDALRTVLRALSRHLEGV